MERKYWPFVIPSSGQLTEEVRREVAFFSKAHEEGHQAYLEEGSAFGVISRTGSEGVLIHRGKGRYWQVILDPESMANESFYVDGFENAAEAILMWVRGNEASHIRSLMSAHIVRRPGERGW
jgi:hypothetical protein